MPSNLSARLEPQFGRNVRHRGEEYFRSGLVRIERATETELQARVRGSLTYDVKLNFGDGILSVWCECPYFVDNGIPCKHLWATILAAEAEESLPAAAAAQKLVLSEDFETPFEGADADLETQPAGWRNSFASRSALPVTPRRRVPVVPSWRQQFSEIVAPGSRPPMPDATWPAKREVL